MIQGLSRLVTAALLCCGLAGPALAQYRGALSVGWGDDETRLVRLGLARDWQRAWFTGGDWQLGGYWLAEVGYWDSDEHDARNEDLWEVGLTPVLRLAPKASDGMRPYLEAGIGGHILSDTRIGRRELSTAWQFGSHLGAGLACGPFEVGYRFQHLSNAGIKKPNDGINFHMLTLGLRF